MRGLKFMGCSLTSVLNGSGWIARRLGVLGVVGMLMSLVARAATHEIEIGEGSFLPDQLSVDIGDRVEWVALSAEHTVTADDGSFDSLASWDTVPLGEKFGVTFLTPGVFRYYCTIHGSPGGSGMAGVIVVSAVALNRPPAIPANAAPLPGAVDQALTPVLRSGAFSDPDAGDFHGASQWVVRVAPNGPIVFDSGDDSVGRVQRAVPAGLLSEFTSYAWQVRHRDGRGAWSGYSVPTTFRTLQPVAAAGIGLKASYWNVLGEGEALATVTNATVQFAWGNERPHRRITADAFGARWEGWLVGQHTERHEFEIEAQGQVRVWVDGERLIDDWAPCSFSKSRKAWLPLVAGKPVSIRLDYVADPTGGQLVLKWSSATQAAEVIPASRLYPSRP